MRCVFVVASVVVLGVSTGCGDDGMSKQDCAVARMAVNQGVSDELPADCEP